MSRKEPKAVLPWHHNSRHKRLHPVQLKGSLAAAMRRDKRELPHGDFAPNFYTISLSPEDFQRWAGLKWKVVEQFKRYLDVEIRDEQYRLEADLFVEIQPAPEIPIGEFMVEAAFRDPSPTKEPLPLLVPMLSHEDGIFEFSSGHSPSTSPIMSEVDDDDGTVILKYESAEPASRLGNSQSPLALIKILEGEDKGVSFYVDEVPITIGRIGRGADISLRDANRFISRKQFEIIRHKDGSFHLTDLCCREDLRVYVNGEQAEPTIPLYSGDHIRLGTAKTAVTEMEFTVL